METTGTIKDPSGTGLGKLHNGVSAFQDLVLGTNPMSLDANEVIILNICATVDNANITYKHLLSFDQSIGLQKSKLPMFWKHLDLKHLVG